MHARPCQPSRPRVATGVVLFCVLSCLLAAAPRALADAVKIGGFWIENTKVEAIADGKLRYISPAGTELARPLKDIEGIRVDSQPAVAEAEALMAEGKHADAVAKLTPLDGRVRPNWLRDWVRYRLVKAADAAGQAPRAVDTYIKLAGTVASGQTDASLISEPPLQSVQAGNDSQKRVVTQRLEAAAERYKEGPAAAGITALLNAARGEAPAATNGGSAMPAGPADLKNSKVVMPRAIRADGITGQLARGEFEQAIESTGTELEGRLRGNELALRLYQRGLAQLHLGLARDDEALIRDAGISFMRVIVHFGSSIYAGGAWLEAGIVHQQIDRPDLARMCFDRAGLYIDPDADPALNARLEAALAKLLETKADASDDGGTNE